MGLQQEPDKLLLVASTRLPQRAGCPAQLQVLIPKMDGYFTGTGKSERHSKQLPTVRHQQPFHVCATTLVDPGWQNCMLVAAYWQTYVCNHVAQLKG